jgi:hypothetical protein
MDPKNYIDKDTFTALCEAQKVAGNDADILEQLTFLLDSYPDFRVDALHIVYVEYPAWIDMKNSLDSHHPDQDEELSKVSACFVDSSLHLRRLKYGVPVHYEEHMRYEQRRHD